jgi:integrase
MEDNFDLIPAEESKLVRHFDTYRETGVVQVIDTVGVQISDEAKEIIRDYSYAPNTLIGYVNSLRHFESYCQKQGITVSLPFPAYVIINYLAYMTKVKDSDEEFQYKVSVAEQHLYAIRVLHSFRFYEEDPTRHPALLAFMKGLRKKFRGQKQKQAPALLKDDMKIIIREFDMSKPISIRNKAMLLVGWYCALRGSELLGIEYLNLTRDDRGRGFVLEVPYSKTDQQGNGMLKVIPYRNDDPDYCPATALARYLEIVPNREMKGISIWRSVTKGGNVTDKPYNLRNFNHWISRFSKARQKGDKIVMDNYSSHSLRAGFITTCKNFAINYTKIMNQSGHKDLKTLSKYNRPSEAWMNNAATEI